MSSNNYKDKIAMLRKKHVEAYESRLDNRSYNRIIESQNYKCYFEHCYKLHDSGFKTIGPWWNPDSALVCPTCYHIYQDMLEQFEEDGEINWNWVMGHEKANIDLLADIAISIKDMLDAI